MASNTTTPPSPSSRHRIRVTLSSYADSGRRRSAEFRNAGGTGGVAGRALRADHLSSDDLLAGGHLELRLQLLVIGEGVPLGLPRPLQRRLFGPSSRELEASYAERSPRSPR